jgi:hypothetical protein
VPQILIRTGINLCGSLSVPQRFLYVIDGENLYLRLLRFQLKPKLLLNCVEKEGPGRV